MIRKLLIIACLLCSVDISAQSRYELQYDENKMPEKPGKYEGKTSYKQPGDPMPPFKVITLPWVEIFNDGGKEKVREISPMKTITNADLPKDKYTIIMLFNPTCGHCEEQTEQFEKNIGLFKNVQLLFIAAPIMGPYLGNYATKYHLNEYPQIWCGLDYDNFIDKAFLYYALPQLCIYDKNQKLIKNMSGGTPIDSLKQYIQ